MKKIVLLDAATFPDKELTKPDFAHEWVEYANTNLDEVLARIADANIVLTNKVPIGREVIRQCPNLELIAVTATGYNIIDVVSCQHHGITVCNVAGYAKHTVAEHVFAMILALQKNLMPYSQDVAAGKWQNSPIFCFLDYPISELHGKTLGIIGAGDIGKQVAKIGEAFSMTVLLASARKGGGEKSGYVSLDELYERANVISLHCPLNEDTKDLLTLATYQKMQQKPIIINTGRGGIANEADTVKALDARLIAGIGFDCLSVEPLAADNPLLMVAERANVIITPHVGWASAEAIDVVWQGTIDNIESYVKGNPQNAVN